MKFTIIDNVGFCRSTTPVSATKCITIRVPIETGEVKVQSAAMKFSAKLHGGVGVIPPSLLAPPGIYKVLVESGEKMYDLGALKSSGGLVTPSTEGLAQTVAKLCAICKEQQKTIKEQEEKISELYQKINDFKFF